MMTELKPYAKPLPNIDYDIKPFWDAVKEHEFKLFRCKVCGAWYWPVACCRNHENEPFFGNMEWTKASGRGKVFAFNIHYVAFDPAFQDDIPYVYALIELEEGPIIGSNIVGCAAEDVTYDMPVEVVYEDITPEYTLPKFRPVK
jgi:uncharacterized OB-fold protein